MKIKRHGASKLSSCVHLLEDLGQEEKGTTEWDGWMVSLTQWTWVCVDSGSCWWTGRPGVLRFMGSQRVGHDWVTELNWALHRQMMLYCVLEREGDDRGCDGWMPLPTIWTWIWVDSGICWWTRRPGMLRFMGLQRLGQDWATKLNWTE